MRILYVLELYHPAIGGTETLFKSIIDHMPGQGHQATVLTTRISNTPKKEVDGDTAIFRISCWNRYLFTLFAFIPALRLARKADAIHTTSYNAAIPAFIAGWLTRRPVVITFHEVWGELWFELPHISRLSRYLHYYFEQALLKLPFAKFIAVSDHTASRLEASGIRRERIQRIYNGIDYQDWQVKVIQENPSSNVMHLLYFGRLGHSKGTDILIPAMKCTIDKGYAFHLCMIIPEEDCVMRRALEDDIKTHGLNDFIKLQSQVAFDQLKKRVAEADAVVIPSYAEGFCYVAVETMAIGTPIIHSGRGALQEVIGGQHIRAEKHTIKGWCEALIRAHRGTWSSDPVKSWPLRHTVHKYHALYEHLHDE